MATQGQPIVVTVDDASMADVQAVAKRLGESGMRVHQVLEMTGVITGHSGDAKKETLMRVPGVSSVEDDIGVQLAPPDASIQ